MNKNLATIPDAGKLDNPRAVWEIPEGEDNGSGAPIMHGIPLPELKFDGGIGEFTDADGDTYDYKTGVKIIPVLALGTSRIYWRKGFKLPVCGSNDNREPWQDIDYEAVDAGPMCMNCQYGQWDNGKAPECKEVHNYAVILADDADATLHLLKVAGNSIKPMRQVWAQLPKNRRSYGNVIHLTAERRDADGNRYYVVTPDLTGGYPAAELFETYALRYETAKTFLIPDRAALARKLREEERRAGRGQNAIPGFGFAVRPDTMTPDLPYEETPQIGEPGSMLFEPDGQRRLYGVDGRIEPVISEAQIEYIEELCKAIDFGTDQINGLTVELFGDAGAGELHELAASEASTLIDRLKVLKAELKKAAPKAAKA